MKVGNIRLEYAKLLAQSISREAEISFHALIWKKVSREGLPIAYIIFIYFYMVVCKIQQRYDIVRFVIAAHKS